MACGDVNRIRRYLDGEKVCMWTELEDLALEKAENEPEFQVLLAEKGIGEINLRRAFLKSVPVTSL